jgi:hypothetical protein
VASASHPACSSGTLPELPGQLLNETKRHAPCLGKSMDRTHLPPLIGLFAIVLQSSFPQPARAEEPPQPRSVNTGRSLQPRLALALRHSDDLRLGTDGTHSIQRAEIPASPVPRECKPKYMVGPGIGIPLGLGTATFGGVLTYAATVDIFGSTPNSAGGIAGGTLLIGAGLATFIYSSIKLSKNRHTRERLCSPGTVPHWHADTPTRSRGHSPGFQSARQKRASAAKTFGGRKAPGRPRGAR